ncbi:hypothetical protein ZHAS_00015817 [Anopheles sinensis]|uniref:Uncharacterized protein n=1 Tax=Anopheles sinensis TaxID=74873 RepID=A0A084WC05_ANOSI|nr:hypothetical protein ZHAS_00015817 [Anopheles sinensis]
MFFSKYRSLKHKIRPVADRTARLPAKHIDIDVSRQPEQATFRLDLPPKNPFFVSLPCWEKFVFFDSSKRANEPQSDSLDPWIEARRGPSGRRACLSGLSSAKRCAPYVIETERGSENRWPKIDSRGKTAHILARH